MAKKMETQESEEEIRDAFKVFDKDNTGKWIRSASISVVTINCKCVTAISIPHTRRVDTRDSQLSSIRN